jgi:hypothetical protein
MVLEKQVRFPPAILQVQAGIEDHIVMIGKGATQQGGLTDLPHARHHDHGKVADLLQETIGLQAGVIHPLQISDAIITLQG